MELRDLVVTPFFALLIIVAAFFLRPYFTDKINRVYFIPALIAKMFGALALGFIYQFYYDGGDTFNFHTHGSRHVWQAFFDSPWLGLKMLFSNGQMEGEVYKYAARIPFYQDSSAYSVIRVASFFDLFTFSTYSATAMLFSLFSFFGLWLLFVTFYQRYPELHKPLAAACLFVPSTIFWGSGILKDTIVMACLGILTFETDRIFVQKKISIFHAILFLISFLLILNVKKFVLQAFIPCLAFWVFLSSFDKIRSWALRIFAFPILLTMVLLGAYYSVLKLGEGDSRYAVDKIAETAKVTAYDIRFQTGREAGSGYTLGELDGSISSMLRLAPAGVNVALFRPYPWEVRNPLMAISALESCFFLIVIIIVCFRGLPQFMKQIRKPDVAFCISFTIIYAFAVGVSTFNFGTLSRYKIPMVPFFAVAIVLIYYSNNSKKLDRLEATE